MVKSCPLEKNRKKRDAGRMPELFGGRRAECLYRAMGARDESSDGEALSQGLWTTN